MSKGKVYLGMSGGVDSSVSAALLQEQGYDVTGIFITVWQPDFIVCTATADRLDAMRVCAALGIPFRDLDLTDVYKREVVDYMVREYSRGRTPNPDVMCNQHVKFGAFFEWAIREGADFVATGHYAQSVQNPASKAHELQVSKDVNKDQTYFLWTLTMAQLAKTLFPVGGMQKAEVRQEAERFHLPTATKKDSQGLCFIGKLDLKEFLSHFVESKQGEVLSVAGAVIGTHDGALFYTLGQRHGFHVDAKTPSDQPLYVVAKDVVANTITVGDKGPGSTAGVTHGALLSSISWISGAAPDLETPIEARFRYRQKLLPVTVHPRGSGSLSVRFNEGAEYVPVGQSVVFYREDTCLGGGIIEETTG